MPLRPRARLGLRARITLAFGLGALVLSVLLASVTWGLTRENLLNQRERSAVDRVLVNATAITDQIAPDADILKTLQGVSPAEGATPLIRIGGEWTGVNPAAFGPEAVDPMLLALVDDGTPARMRYVSGGDPVLVVGVPLPAQDAIYFEGITLTELENTLNGLAIILLLAGTVTTVAGFGVGFYASGRTLRPLVEVGEAAEAIAGGRLDTRLEGRSDPDLRPLTDSFNHMAQALEERVERDARFASEVSHELRSPVMTLTASIEVLQNCRDDLPERAVTAVDLLGQDIERFQQLVEDLLEISRFDAGAVHLQLDEVFAGEFVRQAVATLQGPGIAVQVSDDAAEAIIRVDKRRMARVVANLLDNARKYGEGATSVCVDVVGDQLHIVIEDGGPGVPIEDRGVIFDRFSRGNAGGRRGDDLGTGLGLALIREHVTLHGGRVWVEDRRDGAPGARFVVEIATVDLDQEPEPDDDGADSPLDQAVSPETSELAAP